MIIGDGMIATAFSETGFFSNNKYLVFASGVSNSKETNQYQFNREYTLLSDSVKQFPRSKLIYFSTCSVKSADMTPYVLHKKNVERLIENACKNYHIFRLPQVAGNSANNSLLLNYLVKKILSNKAFVVWKDTKRNIIDIADVVSIVEAIVRQDILLNQKKDIASPYTVPVLEIVRTIEKYMNIKANYSLINRKAELLADIMYLRDIIDVDMHFKNNHCEYLTGILKKYYSYGGRWQ